MNSLVSRNSLLDDFFRDFSPGYFIKPLHGDNLPAQIKVDVKEVEGGYAVNAEIPGVSKDDIHVGIDGNVITLRAEVKQEDKKTEGEKVLRSERYYGAVSRSFQLPAEIDAGAAKAKYENGVLALTLPKKVGASVKRLTVE
ncbi:MAG: Hsp20/alpha crystallin family protein [Burkholderiales bacterium]